MTKRKTMGRQYRTIPRKSRHCYMTDALVETIQSYQNSVIERGKACSFSDAVEHMVEAATRGDCEPEFVPANEVLGVLPGNPAPPWISVDIHNGQHVHCSSCNETYCVPSNRFATYLKGIGAFIEAHRGCQT